jgi:hypothetical protein
VLHKNETLSRIRIDIRMAVHCERGRYILHSAPSIRHEQGIQFPPSSPIPECKEQFQFPVIFRRTTEPEVPAYSCAALKYSGNHLRILKIVVAVGWRMGRVGQFAGRSKPWHDLFTQQCGSGESQPRHNQQNHLFPADFFCFKSPARPTAASILLDRVSSPALGASFTSVRIAAISSRYWFIRRSKVRRSFVQTKV